jgi:hypothetical protein
MSIIIRICIPSEKLVTLREIVFARAIDASPLLVQAALRARLERARMSTAIVAELGFLSAALCAPTRGLGLRDLFACGSGEHDRHEE